MRHAYARRVGLHQLRELPALSLTQHNRRRDFAAITSYLALYWLKFWSSPVRI